MYLHASLNNEHRPTKLDFISVVAFCTGYLKMDLRTFYPFFDPGSFNHACAAMTGRWSNHVQFQIGYADVFNSCVEQTVFFERFEKIMNKADGVRRPALGNSASGPCKQSARSISCICQFYRNWIIISAVIP